MGRIALLSAIIVGASVHYAFAAADEIERGRYLAAVMDCATCHTDGSFLGKPDTQHPLAGSSIAHQVAGLGIFWPPNLTPDRETGLGAWTVQDISVALREGRRPDGRVLAPAMPWRAYSHLSEADARAIGAYLKSLPPITSAIRPPAGPNDPVTTPVVRVIMP